MASLEKSLTENASSLKTDEKGNALDRELNLTEYERQVRQAHGLGSDRFSAANGSQIAGGSQNGILSPQKDRASFARDGAGGESLMNLRLKTMQTNS